MALKVAERGRIPPFIVMDVLRAANERAAEGVDVVHLEVGQPGSGAPEGVIAAAAQALGADRLGYTDALGIPELRRRIAAHYQDWYGVSLPWERVVVTTGSSGGFILAFLAAFDAGDRVALAEPGYPAYRNILSALDIEPVALPVDAGTRFQPTVQHLQSLDRPIDGLIVASPSNPTGTMLPRQALSELATYCRTHGIRLISDEIYHGITYDAAASSALEFGDEAVVINSFSKYFSMTGWRLGWMVLPEALMRAVECLSQNLFISPPALSQHAGVAAFDCHADLGRNVARYARNRDLLLRELPRAGFDEFASSDGAFYLFADVGRLTNDSVTYCQRMLADIGVAATPGVDFDPRRGHRFLRFSFAGSTEEMEEALRRLHAWRG